MGFLYGFPCLHKKFVIPPGRPLQKCCEILVLVSIGTVLFCCSMFVWGMAISWYFIPKDLYWRDPPAGTSGFSGMLLIFLGMRLKCRNRCDLASTAVCMAVAGFVCGCLGA